MAETGKEAPGVSGVAGRYASALFELARDEGAIDQVSHDLDRFDGLLRESPELMRLVKSPVFTSEEQARAVLGQYPADVMDAYEVSSAVNSPAHNTPANIERVAPRAPDAPAPPADESAQGSFGF